MRFPATLAAPLNVIPMAAIERTTSMLFQRVTTQHPHLFARLGEHIEKRFAFMPTDIPLVFVVSPAQPSIHVARRLPVPPTTDASVEGPLFMLLALRMGDLSIVSALTALYPAGTILLAAIVLRERVAAVQWIGLALALAAGGMLAVA